MKGLQMAGLEEGHGSRLEATKGGREGRRCAGQTPPLKTGHEMS